MEKWLKKSPKHKPSLPNRKKPKHLKVLNLLFEVVA
jgi:hypothetical protein